MVGKEAEADYRSREVPLLRLGSQYHSYSLQWPSSDSSISSIGFKNAIAPGRKCEKVGKGHWKYWKQIPSLNFNLLVSNSRLLNVQDNTQQDGELKLTFRRRSDSKNDIYRDPKRGEDFRSPVSGEGSVMHHSLGRLSVNTPALGRVLFQHVEGEMPVSMEWCDNASPPGPGERGGVVSLGSEEESANKGKDWEQILKNEVSTTK